MEDIIDIIVTETTNLIEITSQPTDEIIDVNIIDNREDITLNVTPSVVEININSLTGNFGVNWGDIEGTLSNQTDLQNVLNAKADLVDGKVPSSQLPSYVDDVVEVANYALLPVTGEVGKIYITLDTNFIYRWSGSTYIEIKDSSAVWGAITGTLSSQTDLQSALNAKVPYTGATGNVNLGEYGATVGYLGFDTTPTSTPTGIGTTYWDSFYRTLSLIDGDGDTTLQIGQEERVLVHNNTGSTLTDGQVVYVTGSTGELPSVALASNTSETTSSVTFGIVTESIVNGANGFITTSGIIHGLNTLGLTEGGAIWLGSTAGTFTQTKPVAPANSVLVGYVIKVAGGNGSIFVKIINGSELDELHDVLITSKANNDGLFYESSTSLWKNKSIATVLGYTPANDSLVVHLAGTETITGTKTFSSSVTAPNFILSGGTGNTGLYFGHTDKVVLANYVVGGGLDFETNGGAITMQLSSAGNLSAVGTITGASIIKSGGTSSQFLKADGSVDSSTYLTTVTAASTYVALTGNQSISGVKTFTTQLAGAQLRFSESGGFGNVSGYTQIGGTADYFNFVNGGNTKQATFNYGTGGSGYTYTLPNSNGTIALTSQLSSYLPLSGGTLTGALSGTSASFSSSIEARGNIAMLFDGTSTNQVIMSHNGSSAILYSSGNTTKKDFTIYRDGGVDIGLIIKGSSGNVGIGTTSPSNILHAVATLPRIIADTSSQYAVLNLYASGSEKGAFYLDNTAKTIILEANGDNTYPLLFRTGGSERMRITSGGNIRYYITAAYGDTNLEWYNTSSNTVQVKIWGDGNPRLNAQVGGSGGVYLASGATSWTSASDERLKTDLMPIENATEKVSQLRSMIGRYKTDAQDKKRSFLIAQDVLEVLPEAVDIDAKTGTMGVQYAEVIPLLVASIKELKAELDTLKNK